MDLKCFEGESSFNLTLKVNVFVLRRIWILSANRGGEECAINVAFIQVMPFTMDIVRKHLRL